MKIQHLLTLVAGLLGWGRPGLAEDVTTLLAIEPTAQYPRHSEGDVVEFADGRIGLIYTRFTGGPNDESAADIVLRTADAAGRDWDAGRVLIPRGDAQNVMSVSTIRSADGGWLLFYLRKIEGRNHCHMFVCRTTDEFKTLSHPVRITSPDGYYVVNNDRVIRLSTGRLILPAALHPFSDNTETSWQPGAICKAFMSDDDGRTWREQKGPGIVGPALNSGKDKAVGATSATTTSPARAATSVVLQEPGIVELKDGRVMMWFRTSESTQYQSFSNDGGDHWTEPAPGPLVSARLSPASIHRIPWTGDLLAVWNDQAGVKNGPTSKRTPLSIAISKDDGKTWSKSRTIEPDPDGWYCYTSITFIKDRAILSYCAGDKKVGGLNRLKVVALTREQLK